MTYTKGHITSEATKQKIREKILKRKEKLGYINSPSTRTKMSEASKKTLNGFKKGEKHPNWKGGIGYDKKVINKRSSDWNKNHKESRAIISKVYGHKRRVFLRNLNGSFSSIEWEDKKKEYGYCCAFCKISEIDLINKTGMGLTLDHKIPISKWVEFIKNNKVDYKCNDIQNIQPLCSSCNCKKLNKILC